MLENGKLAISYIRYKVDGYTHKVSEHVKNIADEFEKRYSRAFSSSQLTELSRLDGMETEDIFAKITKPKYCFNPRFLGCT